MTVISFTKTSRCLTDFRFLFALVQGKFVVFADMEGGERFEDVGNVQMYWEASDALLVLTYHVPSYPPGISP